jgi:hypothetical protein
MVHIMESNTKKGMKLMAKNVGAAGTGITVWEESDNITMDAIADATSIMLVWGFTDGSYPAKKSSQN